MLPNIIFMHKGKTTYLTLDMDIQLIVIGEETANLR